MTKNLANSTANSFDAFNKSGGDDIFRSLIENTDSVYCIVKQNTILYVNAAFETLWGRSVDEAMSDIQRVKFWIHPDDIKTAFQWIARTDIVHEEEYFRVLLPGGAIKWVWNKIYFDQLNQYFILTLTDVTKLKQVEAELIIARDKAQESDRLKTSFLANISHEIRTPMNGIIGFSNLLAEEDFSTKEIRQEYANIIINSSEQLLNIIDDIIDVAKIESNQLRIAPIKVPINKVLDQVYTLFEIEKKRKEKQNIQLVVKKGLLDNQSVILTDEFRLRQVLMNLLNNALKFTREGQITFGYDIEFENNSPYLVFFVKDTGVGIAREKQSLIFNNFYQVESAGAHSFRSGTGLGLAICQGLIRLLGGRIWVKSEEKIGTTFYFTLPYHIPTDDSNSDGPSEPISSINLKDKSVLIVEDDDLNYEIIARLLGGTNVRIDRAPSGNVALTKIDENSFDFVLLDIRLPDINGYDICKYIRQKNTQIPIIAQTANAYPEDRKRCMDEGFSDFLTKPLSRQSLMNAIVKTMVCDEA